MKRSEAIAKRALEKLGNELESEYREERKSAAERLHNAFAEVIGQQQPSVETLLYVLEMLRFGILEQQQADEFGPGNQIAPVPSEGKPSTIGFGVM